jgi:succinoglycan biosynthesis transport protein ExoP
MIENSSSQASSSDPSRNFVSPFIQSQSLSEGQNEEFNFPVFIGIIRRRALVITGVAIVAMVASLVYQKLNQKPLQYESNFQLLVEPVNDDNKVADVVAENNSGNMRGLDYDSQIQVLKSPEILGSIIQQLHTSYPDINYDSLLQALTINRLGETKIIDVRYTSNDTNKIKVVLDKISQEYLDYSREKRQTKLRQGIKFVEKELPFIQNRVDHIQKELQIFRQKNRFNDPNTEAERISTQITTLSEKRQTVDLQLAQARDNIALLQGEDGKIAALTNAPLYQQLLLQVRQLETQIATESTRLQEENPSIQGLKEKRDSLLPLLNLEAQRVLVIKFAELQTQFQTLEGQSQEMARVQQELEQKRKELPMLARRYTELQRKLQVATESLNRFLNTRETLQIQISQTELGWQLLQAPIQPNNPISSSNIKGGLLGGLAASIAVGIGVALLIEKVDKSYHSVDSLKENVKLPLLGNLPFEKQLQSSQSRIRKSGTPIVRVPNLLTDGIPGSVATQDKDYRKYSPKFLEALRVLYTNIQLLSSDRQIRSVVISSAIAGDGKSTVAFHLAQIATAMGQRVLLVDADLRQPTIHTLSDLNNKWGLSNLITTNLPMGEVIRELPSMNQLSVITAGPIPPDPTKLLSSEKMKRLMTDFHNSFDFVIYDAPPLVGLADASLIAPHTDGILLVVKIDKTESGVIQRALDRLTISRINALGMVANCQKSDFSGY